MRILGDALISFNSRDLMRAAGCQHCLYLALAEVHDPLGVGALVKEKKTVVPVLPAKFGNWFENQLEQMFVSALPEGQVVMPDEGRKDQFEATQELMRQGVPVIYQGTLEHRAGRTVFNGRPDFLIRADYEVGFVADQLQISQTGDGLASHYVVLDAKAASKAKPQNLLQVGLYIQVLEQLEFNHPGQHGLLLGNYSVQLFDQIDLLPATVEARSKIQAAAERYFSATDFSWLEWQSLEHYCPTTKVCEQCDYQPLCHEERRKANHLAMVANIRQDQIHKLNKAGVSTVAQLGELTDYQRPSSMAAATFQKLRNQAALQTKYLETGSPQMVLLPEPDLLVLPPSSPGDIFFDMEGFPYFRPDGLEYLFGFVVIEGGKPKFIDYWAHDRQEEAKAFADWIDYSVARLQQFPDAHIYHYASYEVTAMKKLSARHGIKEAEVDWLLDNHKFVDLYRMVVNSMQVGFEGYSIKKLEGFYPEKLTRSEAVKNAGDSLLMYDQYREVVAQDPQSAEAASLLKEIRDYNEDDCVSTWHLYNWLRELPGASSNYQEWLRAVNKQAAEIKEREANLNPTDAAAKSKAELAKIEKQTAHLLKALETFPWGKNPETDLNGQAWQTLVHAMLFYKREKVVADLQAYLLTQATANQLDQDRKGLSVIGAEFDGALYHYRLTPDQVHFFKPEDDIYVVYQVSTGLNGREFGKVKSVTSSSVTFTRAITPMSNGAEPTGIFLKDYVDPGSKQTAILSQAMELTADWKNPELPAPTDSAALDLLLRRHPNMGGADMPLVIGDDYETAIVQAISQLQNGVLGIQGPPGSGKTYLASKAIKHLLEAGKKVGVVANGHDAVENLLFACLEAGVPLEKVAKKKKSGDPRKKPWNGISSASVYGNFKAANRHGYLVGGTAWTFTSQMMLDDPFDYIFVDEAAQFSLVDAIGVSAATSNLVLLGDPMQLTQVVQAVHPGGVENSALGHYMGSHEIMPPTLGYFVDVTRRMNPEVNLPVSWLAYQGRLHSHPDTDLHRIDGIEPGLVTYPVEHFGNTSSSDEEVAVAVGLVQDLSKKLDPDQIMVMAPFNAQVHKLELALAQAGLGSVPVGTVDRFQGKQAMAVVISLTASSAGDAPRGLDFILDRNRLNVAISRAKANAYLIYSTGLVQTDFNSVEDLKAVSRLLGILGYAK